MINKKGKLYINKSLHKNRYDMNEDYGVDGQHVKYYEIIKEYKFLGYKFTVSKHVELRATVDFMNLAFDPPEDIEDKLVSQENRYKLEVK